MKILMVHNYYGSKNPSGEDVVVERSVAALREAGHEVVEFSVNSTDLEKFGLLKNLVGALAYLFNPVVSSRIRRLKNSSFDLIHVHNVFPLMSPFALYSFSKMAPVVLTLHNYRTICSAGSPMRDGKVCTKCIDSKNPLYGLIYRCYRASLLASLIQFVVITLHKFLDTYSRCVSLVVVQSEFQWNLIQNNGFSGLAYKVVSPPTDVNLFGFTHWQDKKDRIAFVGRLDRQKGIFVVLDTWAHMQNNGFTLDIIGSGSDEIEVKEYVKTRSLSNVVFHGNVSEQEVARLLGSAKGLLFPTEYLETFGLVVIEAFLSGAIVFANCQGSLGSLVRDGETGISIDGLSPFEIGKKIGEVFSNLEVDSRLQSAARSYAISLCHPQRVSEDLVGAYKKVL